MSPMIKKNFRRLLGLPLCCVSILLLAACGAPPGLTTVAGYSVTTGLDRRPVAQKTQDDLAETRLQLALMGHRRVRGRVFNGRAYVLGYVEDRRQRDAIMAMLVNEKFSDRRVRFMLLGDRSPTWFEDLQANADAGAALITEKSLDSYDIHVIAAGRSVFLFGEVDTLEQKLRAGRVMERVGMVVIDNDLRVEPRTGKTREARATSHAQQQ